MQPSHRLLVDSACALAYEHLPVLWNASRGSDKKIYVIMFSKEGKEKQNLIMIKKIKENSEIYENTDEDEDYDEKEKLIQSHHLNIKTFPQTPLNTFVIQVSVYMYKYHTTH